MLPEFSTSLLYIELFFSQFSDTTIVLQLLFELFDLMWHVSFSNKASNNKRNANCWNRKQKMSEAENKSQFKITFRLRQFKTTKFGLQQINKLIGVKFPLWKEADILSISPLSELTLKKLALLSF